MNVILSISTTLYLLFANSLFGSGGGDCGVRVIHILAVFWSTRRPVVVYKINHHHLASPIKTIAVVVDFRNEF